MCLSSWSILPSVYAERTQRYNFDSKEKIDFVAGDFFAFLSWWQRWKDELLERCIKYKQDVLTGLSGNVKLYFFRFVIANSSPSRTWPSLNSNWSMPNIKRGIQFMYSPFVLWKVGRIRMLHRDHSIVTDTLSLNVLWQADLEILHTFLPSAT